MATNWSTAPPQPRIFKLAELLMRLQRLQMVERIDRLTTLTLSHAPDVRQDPKARAQLKDAVAQLRTLKHKLRGETHGQ